MKPRNPLLAASLLSVFALTFAQGGQFTYSDARKMVAVQAHSGRMERVGSGVDLLTLLGKVSLVSKSQGEALQADTVTCRTALGEGGKTIIKGAVAKGNVHLVKTVMSHSGASVTDISGSRADMANGSKTTVILAGPVKIKSINAAKHQSMLATGASGEATLEPLGHSSLGSGLREAVLLGPVRVLLDAAPTTKGSQATHVIATGDRLILNNVAATPFAQLIGHVEIHGNGDVTGLSRATLRLNKAGEVTGWEVGS